jgi:hypothetical protein
VSKPNAIFISRKRRFWMQLVLLGRFRARHIACRNHAIRRRHSRSSPSHEYTNPQYLSTSVKKARNGTRQSQIWSEPATIRQRRLSDMREPAGGVDPLAAFASPKTTPSANRISGNVSFNWFFIRYATRSFWTRKHRLIRRKERPNHRIAGEITAKIRWTNGSELDRILTEAVSAKVRPLSNPSRPFTTVFMLPRTVVSSETLV